MTEVVTGSRARLGLRMADQKDRHDQIELPHNRELPISSPRRGPCPPSLNKSAGGGGLNGYTLGPEPEESSGRDGEDGEHFAAGRSGRRMNDLQRRLAEGEAAAYAELYDWIAGRLYHYLVSQTGTREDAADLLQETFLRIHRSGARLGEVEHLKAYCFRIAHHEMLRWRKKHQARHARAELLYEIAAPSDPNGLETREAVTHALNQ